MIYFKVSIEVQELPPSPVDSRSADICSSSNISPISGLRRRTSY